jgi:hypothetical protein
LALFQRKQNYRNLGIFGGRPCQLETCAKFLAKFRLSHATEVGAWSEAGKIAFAMAPNSAGAERVLSMLKTLFGSNQDSALADFIRSSMMLHYNNSMRSSEAAKA